MILVPPFATFFERGSILVDINYGLVILMAIIFTSTSFKELLVFLFLGSTAYLLFILDQSPDIVSAFISILFFTLIFVKMMNYIWQSKKISLNDVFACISGYLVIGIIAALLFYMIEMNFPNSFILPEDTNFYDFIYYGYITLTTVGFGDIVPVHPFAKSFTIFISIFGQLYLTILVAIIIGKFLAAEMTE